jgi:hypothetical protein
MKFEFGIVQLLFQHNFSGRSETGSLSLREKPENEILILASDLRKSKKGIYRFNISEFVGNPDQRKRKFSSKKFAIDLEFQRIHRWKCIMNCNKKLCIN